MWYYGQVIITNTSSINSTYKIKYLVPNGFTLRRRRENRPEPLLVIEHPVMLRRTRNKQRRCIILPWYIIRTAAWPTVSAETSGDQRPRADYFRRFRAMLNSSGQGGLKT